MTDPVDSNSQQSKNEKGNASMKSDEPQGKFSGFSSAGTKGRKINLSKEALERAKNLFLEECQDVPIRAPQFQSGPDNVHPVQLKQFDGFSSGTIHKLRHIKS